ncbi:hypothetical protein Lalb_Chr00c21g0405861 (mitochondrion) [Lupinus albus]|uniref:Uncharacterized protein n=1 Tax=Lupinus albus TaxID=3870 RepID=A0A6A4N0Z2_LUPAL|nr:hypothetical protein Lalb_Chr00c24g0406991 [Lupinus albus]KAE9584352.1 hypothetical protein Lalb_Chr00c21g0405861 [Lupinus albus]
MQNFYSLTLWGNPTPSDWEFIIENEASLSFSSSTSSTRSDAQSAPPECEEVLQKICDESTKWVGRSGRQLPPEWTMPDLVRAVISDDRIDSPGFLTSVYTDVILHGQNAWLCEDIFSFIDLIHYVF